MDFYAKVAFICKKIPYGRVATYGQIALLCGKPRNSRQVGYGLKRRMSGEMPAHRVVNAKGFLSGASAFSIPGQQRMLLEAEGVEVDANQCVDLKKYGWHNTLEEALEIHRCFKVDVTSDSEY